MNATTDSRDAWLRQPAAMRLLEAERERLAEEMSNLFGYYLLQVGGWGGRAMPCAESRIRNRFVLDLAADGADFVADPEHWPVASDSVDVVVLPHTLELVSDPHHVLRETERVLIGEGHVVVLGFSPWSTWAFRRRRKPWLRQFVSERRLRDWLALLGFDLVSVRRHAHALPRLFPGAYMVVARKRVVAMTPLRPAWPARPRGAAAGAGI